MIDGREKEEREMQRLQSQRREIRSGERRPQTVNKRGDSHQPTAGGTGVDTGGRGSTPPPPKACIFMASETSES